MKSFKSLFCASLLTLAISSATLAGNISGGAPSTISGNISGGAPCTISDGKAGNISGGAPSSISGLADELYAAILGLLLL